MPIKIKGGKTDEQVFCLCNFLLENASCFYPIDYTSAFLRLLCNLAPVEQGPTIQVDLIQVKLSSQGLVLTTAVLIEILIEFFLYCEKSRKSSKDVMHDIIVCSIKGFLEIKKQPGKSPLSQTSSGRSFVGDPLIRPCSVREPTAKLLMGQPDFGRSAFCSTME